MTVFDSGSVGGGGSGVGVSEGLAATAGKAVLGSNPGGNKTDVVPDGACG